MEPHIQIINESAKAVLKPLGMFRAGRSRTFFILQWRCFPIKNNNNSKEMLVNENIDFADSKNVRVIGEDGEQLGVFPFSTARSISTSQTANRRLR